MIDVYIIQIVVHTLFIFWGALAFFVKYNMLITSHKIQLKQMYDQKQNNYYKEFIIQMQELIDYNFLIIGRSGSGKSATSKLLTGDLSIIVANSINEVTKQVKFYRGISHFIGREHIRFGILDIPGLDRIDNRFTLRQVILDQLQKLGIALHGIIYIASLTERDTIDQAKLFSFIDQLPWPNEHKKSCLIPILTKYDNFIIDSPEEDIGRTKQQFHKLFLEKGYQIAWSKRIYWVNFTKSLDFKIKVNEDIRQKHETQIERLVQQIKKNKKGTLTAQSIKQYIQKEQKYVLQHFLKKLDSNEIPFTLVQKVHQMPLHIKIQPSKVTQSLTAFSASSIGILIARIFKHDISFPVSLIMMGIPMTLTFLNLIIPGGQQTAEKLGVNQFSNCKVISNFGKICQKINEVLQQQWKELNKNIDFSVQNKYLRCKFHKNAHYKFFNLQNIQLKQEQNQIEFQKEKVSTENISAYIMPIPALSQGIWDPIISIKYGVKVFEELTIMKMIGSLRAEFNSL